MSITLKQSRNPAVLSEQTPARIRYMQRVSQWTVKPQGRFHHQKSEQQNSQYNHDTDINGSIDQIIPTIFKVYKNYVNTHIKNRNLMPITEDKFFKITSVHRDDLENIGFDTSNVDDSTMQHLASKMADDYCEQLFWIHPTIFAEMTINPRKKDYEVRIIRVCFTIVLPFKIYRDISISNYITYWYI